MALSTHLQLVALAIVVIVNYGQGQLHVNDDCTLHNGIAGVCVRFENCLSAIEMVRTRTGRPQHCGFEGLHSVVCCETKVNILTRRVGEISNQKCREQYENLPATTTPKLYVSPTTKTTTTTTSSSVSTTEAILDFADLIKLAEQEDEERRKAGLPANTVWKTAVGGEDARPQEFPHMAVLGYGPINDITWGCGGSLISLKHILTAGHCINTHLGPVQLVRVGDLNLKSSTDVAMEQDYGVVKTTIHPKYKPPSVYNDIAIIEISSEVTVNDYVRPGCLYTQRFIPDGVWSATGWGVTSYQGTPANHLQEVKIRQFTFEECQAAYNQTSKRRLGNGIDDQSQICAGETAKDTCQGDSGGPLQIKNSDYPRGYQIVGVTSFGKACGIGKAPSVYTRVSNYIEWIESVIWPVM